MKNFLILAGVLISAQAFASESNPNWCFDAAGKAALKAAKDELKRMNPKEEVFEVGVSTVQYSSTSFPGTKAEKLNYEVSGAMCVDGCVQNHEMLEFRADVALKPRNCVAVKTELKTTTFGWLQ